MTETAIHDQAFHLYYECTEIAVSPNGERWDVFDGPDGPRVATVDTAVLTYMDEAYDMPILNLDGSTWWGDRDG